MSKESKDKREKIKLFQLAQTSYAKLGIISNQSNSKSSFNWRLLLTSLSYGSSSVFYIISYEKELKWADSFADYTDWIFTFTSTISVDIFYVCTILNKAKLFSFIKNCEKIVHLSE